MTRATLKDSVRSNLFDSGVTFYSDDDLNDSIQDAYDDVVVLTQCIIKKTTVSWISNKGYLDPVTDLAVTDYMAVTAIFNNNSNLWLRDDVSLRNFDALRIDWENWVGQPQMWAPVNNKYFAIAPKMLVASGTFDLYYWATAPTLSGDSDTFLIATDMQILLEQYTTADMLEQAQEYVKAQSPWWADYYAGIIEYAERCKKLAKSDLLMRI